MSFKKVAPAPTHARTSVRFSKKENSWIVWEGERSVYQSPEKSKAQAFAAVEESRLARNAANRAKYKAKLWECRLYVRPEDDAIKAKLLAQNDISGYIKGLIESDIDGPKSAPRDGSSVIHGIPDHLLSYCSSFTWSNEKDGRHYIIELASGAEYIDENGESMDGGDFATVYNALDFLNGVTWSKKGRK